MAEADPDPWRRAMRETAAESDLAERRRALEELARAEDLGRQPPRVLTLFASSLEGSGAPEKAVEILTRAYTAHPDDFWVLHNLGVLCMSLRPPRPAEAVRYLTAAVALRPHSAGVYNNLGVALSGQGKLDEAIAAFRKAIELKPGYSAAYVNLGKALADHRKLNEALAAFRRAIEIDPENAIAYYNLGKTLSDQGNLDESIAANRKAIGLKPDLAEAYVSLGNVLKDQGQLDEAVAAFRKAIELKPDFAMAHYNLGNALKDQGKLEEAIAACRKAIELKPDYAEAHCNMGQALKQQGQYAEALMWLKRCHELGLKDPRWPYPSAQWLEEASAQWLEATRLAAAEAKLAAVLEGRPVPGGAAELVDLASVAYQKKLFASSARLYADALAASPALAGDLKSGHRYNAACAAALAGSGRGDDRGSLDGAGRARWREQALEWLRADLALYDKRLNRGQSEDRSEIRRTLEHWRRDPDFSEVREEEALRKLPPEEAREWRSLWEEAGRLLERIRSSAEGDTER